MGEDKEKNGGFFKSIMTSVIGLLSGAILMYLSPLVNNAIKPLKPVANFAYQADGLSVTFNNRSTGGVDGWWDFGDGSALEPYAANQPTLVHRYSRPGNYPVKLSLNNFLGESAERTVSVVVEDKNPSRPTIESFQVVSLRPDTTAPATFRITAQVKNAELCIWSFSEDRPVEITTDHRPQQERMITFTEYGFKTIRLVAVQGKETTERSETVFVGVPSGKPTPGALVQVTYEALQVERQVKTFTIKIPFDAKPGENVSKFHLAQQLPPGFRIINLEPKPIAHMQGKPQIIASKDGSSFTLSGALVKPAGGLGARQPFLGVNAEITVTMEKSQPIRQDSDPVLVSLSIPGRTMIPMPTPPPGITAMKRTMRLQVRDGDRILWKGEQPPQNQMVQMNNQTYRLSAQEIANQMAVDIQPFGKSLSPLGQ